MRIAGIVLDLYDDPNGIVLRKKIAEAGPLPEKLANSTVESPEDLDRLPDRLFALVGTNNGEVIRKYAMHNEAHLATSIMYFLEQGGLLREDIRQKVAANLINGCAWYEYDPPEPLVKTAMLGSALVAGLGTMDMAAKAREGSERGRARMDEFRRAQASGVKTAGREIKLTADQDRAMQEDRGPEAGYVFGPLDHFSDPARTYAKLDEQLMKIDQPDPLVHKKADLTGTEVMPQGTLSKSVRVDSSKRVSLPGKTAAGKLAAAHVPEGWWDVGDLTGVEPPQRTKKAAVSCYALPHLRMYPIDTAEQIKTAVQYFDEHMTEFPMLERRVYAQSVASQAEELGVKVAGRILEYSGDQYGSYIHGELLGRARAFEGTPWAEAYELLQEKQASVPPAVMVEMLKTADEQSGASGRYGRPSTGFSDPYVAVYGGKTAADPDWSWSAGTDYVNEYQLRELATKTKLLEKLFGDGFVKSFQADPVAIFSSMPEPQKVVLSRLAAD